VTEINVTSPTGIRTIKNFVGADIAVPIWDKIEGQTETGSWSGFDIRYPPSRGPAKRMSNPKLYWQQ